MIILFVYLFIYLLIYLFIYIQVLDSCRKVEDEEIKKRNREEIQFPLTDIDLSDLENPAITQVNHVFIQFKGLFTCISRVVG